MKDVIVVTFPRSGHAVFVSLLNAYFGPGNLRHADSHESGGQIPVPIEGINCHKTHDFHLDVSQDLSMRYIVRYRTPVESIISWFKLNFSKGQWGPERDSESHFHQFAEEKIIFWKRFVRKWVIDSKRGNVEAFTYHDFIRSPLREMERCIVDVYGLDFDRHRMQEIIDCRQIEIKNKISDFKYYSERFIADLERTAEEEIRLLKLPSYQI